MSGVQFQVTSNKSPVRTLCAHTPSGGGGVPIRKHTPPRHPEEMSCELRAGGTFAGARELYSAAKKALLTGEFRLMVVELCCEPDSELARNTPPGCLCIRITEKEDLTLCDTRYYVHRLIRLAKSLEIGIFAWASSLCTFGCRLRALNAAKGIATGNKELTDALISACLAVCSHVAAVDGAFAWEWPERNLLWKRDDVQAFMGRNGAVSCLVSTAAMELSTTRRNDQRQLFFKKRWRVDTSHSRLPGALKPYERVPGCLFPGQFVECRGADAKKSAKYTPLFARVIWEAIRPHTPRLFCSIVENK